MERALGKPNQKWSITELGASIAIMPQIQLLYRESPPPLLYVSLPVSVFSLVLFRPSLLLLNLSPLPFDSSGDTQCAPPLPESYLKRFFICWRVFCCCACACGRWAEIASLHFVLLVVAVAVVFVTLAVSFYRVRSKRIWRVN